MMRILLSTLVSLLVYFESASGQIGYKPADDLVIALDANRGIRFEDDGVPDGRRVIMSVDVATLSKTVVISWYVKNSAGATEKYVTQKQSTSFFPTALEISRNPSNRILIAGRSGSGLAPVVERWDVSNYTISELSDISGQVRTQFIKPSITKESIPCELSVGEISSITSNRHPAGGGDEHVVVFDYTNKQVVSLNPSTGDKTVMIASPEASPYFGVSMRQHSIYGEVCILNATPRGELVMSDVMNEPDLYANYYDLQGVYQGSFIIPNNSTFNDHVLFSTGNWVDGEPYL